MAEVLRTGGNWNPDDRYQYFLVVGANDAEELSRWRLSYPHLLIALNEITSTTEAKMAEMEREGVRWFLDSGIFNLASAHSRKHGLPLNEVLGLPPEQIDGFALLYEKYVAVMSRWQEKAWGYIELDQGGVESKIRLRSKLEEMGLRPIPVYHPFNDGWDYFDYLAARYDRICIGNLAASDGRVRKRILATIWERKQKYPHLWVHLLGFTPSQLLNAYPVDSGDSSSWLNSVRWSGYTEKAMLKSIGYLPKNFQYALGDYELHKKSRAMSAYGAGISVRNWHNHLSKLAAMGGFVE